MDQLGILSVRNTSEKLINKAYTVTSRQKYRLFRHTIFLTFRQIQFVYISFDHVFYIFFAAILSDYFSKRTTRKPG